MNFIPFFIILSVSALAFPVFAEKPESISQEVLTPSEDLKPSEEAPISTWKEALESAYEKNPDLKISQSCNSNFYLELYLDDRYRLALAAIPHPDFQVLSLKAHDA